jgi:hypothetical protein
MHDLVRANDLSKTDTALFRILDTQDGSGIFLFHGQEIQRFRFNRPGIFYMAARHELKAYIVLQNAV